MTTAERAARRAEVSRREVPFALAWAVAMSATILVVDWVFDLSAPTDRAIDLVVVATLLAGLLVARGTRLPSGGASWVMAACATVAVLGALLKVSLRPGSDDFAFVLLAVVAFPPVTLAWRPAIAAAVPMAVAGLLAARHWPAADAANWIVMSAAGLAVGLVLMHLRLRTIDEATDANALAKARATKDQLTGLLNRHGVEERLPQLVGLATRASAGIFAVFVDVDGLKQANDVHGHDFGDHVLRCVAQGVRLATRTGDVVGRWGGDEFIIVGLGHADSPDLLTDRILANIRLVGFDLDRWSGTISVGAASSGLRDRDFRQLLRLADEDMYARRRQRRTLERAE